MPSFATPSTSISPLPIIQSTCVRLSLPPAARKSSRGMSTPPRTLKRYALPMAMCDAAFSSYRVLKKNRPERLMGLECGTRATSPRRWLPSSVSIIFSSALSPFPALAFVMRPSLNSMRMPSIRVPL